MTTSSASYLEDLPKLPDSEQYLSRLSEYLILIQSFKKTHLTIICHVAVERTILNDPYFYILRLENLFTIHF